MWLAPPTAITFLSTNPLDSKKKSSQPASQRSFFLLRCAADATVMLLPNLCRASTLQARWPAGRSTTLR